MNPNPPIAAPQISFEDYVAMSACASVLGYEGMLGHYRITPAQWTPIASHWNAVIPTTPHYASYGVMLEEESARLRAGGAPRPVQLGTPSPYGAQQPYGYPGYNPHAAGAGAQVGSAFEAFGNAVGSFVHGAVVGLSVGGRVWVTWSDGQRYPGVVTAMHAGQVQVRMTDGQQVWVPQQAVSF